MNAHVEKTLEYFQGRNGLYEPPSDLLQRLHWDSVACAYYQQIRETSPVEAALLEQCVDGLESYYRGLVPLIDSSINSWDPTRAVQEVVVGASLWEISRWEICWLLWGMLRRF